MEAARPPSSPSALYFVSENPSNSADDIRCRILQQGALRCGNVEGLSDKASFKAEVPTAGMDGLSNPSAWSAGIQVRPFRDRKVPFDPQQGAGRSYHERRRDH